MWRLFKAFWRGGMATRATSASVQQERVLQCLSEPCSATPGLKQDITTPEVLSSPKSGPEYLSVGTESRGVVAPGRLQRRAELC